MPEQTSPDATETITPPVDCWVTLRISGDKMTKVSADADEKIRLEIRRRDTDA